jgi:hypothetical protein
VLVALSVLSIFAPMILSRMQKKKA